LAGKHVKIATMARKRVGADNTTTILLVVGGLAAVGAVVYFMSKQGSTIPPSTTIYRPPTPGLTNSTAQEIAAGGTAVSSIIEAIGDDNS
jgi:hypothetical protein